MKDYNIPVWVSAIRFEMEKTEVESFRTCEGESFEVPEESTKWQVRVCAVLSKGETQTKNISLGLVWNIEAHNESILEEKVTQYSENIDWHAEIAEKVPPQLDTDETLLPFEAETFVWQYVIDG